VTMPKKFKKLFGATQGAQKMDLDELLGRLPKGTKAQQLEAELMFKRLQEERAAQYAPTNPPTERGNAALREAQSQLRERGKQKFLEPSAEKRRMYHGTRHYKPGTINFDPESRPSGEGIKEFQQSNRGMTFVSPETEFANLYSADVKGGDFMSGAVYPVHVQVRNPFDFQNADHLDVLTDELSKLSGTSSRVPGWIHAGPEKIRSELRSGSWSAIEDPYVMDAAKRLGFDGMYMNEYDVKNLGVFDPKRIKSAIGNQGIYDIENPDITKAHGGEVHMAGGGKLFRRASNVGKGEKSFEAARNLMDSNRPLSLAERQFVAEMSAKQAEELARTRPQELASIETKGKAKPPSPKPARAKPKTKAEINAIAERVAPQMTGEFVRKQGKTENVTSKSRKQFDLEQELEHEMQRSREVPEAKIVNLEPHLGSVMLSLPGDTSISDYDIFSIGGNRLSAPARQYGGPRFGLDHPEGAGWASGFDQAAAFQRRVNAASQQYGDVPVLANYLAMGPEGLNYATHFTDTLLKGIDPTKMSARDIEDFNRMMRYGRQGVNMPDFPGIENPEAAYLYLANNPVGRKLVFNPTMQLTKTTEELGLPSGLNVRHAITEPELRDIEPGMTGFSLLQMEPGVMGLKPSAHPTYSHNIPGKFLGRTDVLMPYELTFPDTVAGIRANPRQAGNEFGTLQFSGGKQIIDQQLLDELEQYRRRIKELTGKKDGGVVHMAGGNEPGESIGEMFNPKPLTIPEPLTDLVDAFKRQFSKEKRSMSKPGAVTDVLLGDVAAPILGAPSDFFLDDVGQILEHVQKTHPLMRNRSVMDQPTSVVDKRPPTFPYEPKVKFTSEGQVPFGSEQIREGMKRYGLISDEQRPLTGFATSILAPGATMKALKYGRAGAQALAPTAKDMLQMQLEKLSEPTRSYVVKPKGGNWLSDAISSQTNQSKMRTLGGEYSEDVLQRMEKLYTPEALEGMMPVNRATVEERFPPLRRDAAINNWIDKKLNNYIKNEMGSPEDSIRLGIERRAVEAEKLKAANQAKLDKMAADIERAKASGKGTAVSERELELAKERFADEEYIASQGLHHDIIPEDGWPAYINWEPEALTYKRRRAGFPEEGMASHPAAKDWEIKTDSELSSFKAGDLQKPQLADTPLIEQNQWINKLDPNATINRLEPDSAWTLNFQHMIDELKNAMDPASNLPDNLKIATKDLEKMTVDDVSALVGKINAWRNVQKGKANLEIANNPATHTFKEYPPENNPKGLSWRQIKRPDGYSDEEAEKFVRQAAQYEGDMMRHCVGGAGHCEPLLNGDVEIYTLRDAKGEPHVTIEVELPKKYTEDDVYEQFPGGVRDAMQKGIKNIDEYVATKLAELNNRPPRILEIKGKSNRKPKDEFIPFVQDFIKSGNWSGINDLHHTDLYDVAHHSLKDFAPKSFEASPADRLIAITAAKRAGELTKGLMTREEWEPIVQKYLPQNKAAGGAVTMAEGGQLTFAKANQMLQQYVSSLGEGAGMAKGGAVDYETSFNEMLQKHVQGMAEGGEVNTYDSDPDVTDGGQFVQAPAFADGGAVKSIWTVN